jgi:alpha-galactosidase
MKYLFILLFTLFFGFGAFAKDHQNLAPTPPMGWNSWNLVEKEVDEQILKDRYKV